MIETKHIRKYKTDEIESSKHFGWQFSEEVRSGGRMHYTDIVFVRDKEMPYYDEIVKLESEYNDLKRQLKHYTPMDPLLCVLLFILLIFPLIIYIAVKRNQKLNYNDTNNKINSKLFLIINNADQLLKNP